MSDWTTQRADGECQKLEEHLLSDRDLVIAANRAPITFHHSADGSLVYTRGSGGLVTALTGLARNVKATWIGCALTDEDREWQSGEISFAPGSEPLTIHFINADQQSYDDYYNVIANPLLWFLQHNMMDTATNPTIDLTTWNAWENGYLAVNRLFADTIVQYIRESQRKTLVMLQDYQLYAVPKFIRQQHPPRKKYTLMHFVHIPWPGTEDWGILPAGMRRTILEGLCSVDLLGFQIREDGLNFIRTVNNYLPRAHVNFRKGKIWFRNHMTYVRDFPISIDVDALRSTAATDVVKEYQRVLGRLLRDRKLILRIDRIEPSKNIVRGFQAMGDLLERHPQYIGQVQFLALLVPSRLAVSEYQTYLGDMMAAAGSVNARFGMPDWEPVRIMVGENYPRAVAAMKMYDALLVNSVADGMNLVAKEGPVVNERDGIVILSERTGARQQLEPGALIISPVDIYATAEAIHQALGMPSDERKERADRLRWIVEREDINAWICAQLQAIQSLGL